MINLCLFKSKLYIPPDGVNKSSKPIYIKIKRFIYWIKGKKGLLSRSLIELSQWSYNEHTAFNIAFFTFLVFAVTSFFSIGIENIVTRIHIFTTIIFFIIIVLKFEISRKKFMKMHVKKIFKKSRIAIFDGTIDEHVGYNRPRVRYGPYVWKKN